MSLEACKKYLRQDSVDGRDNILDNIRGLVILLYVLAHFAMSLMGGHYPTALNHAYRVGEVRSALGFNIIDLAPMAFMFFTGAVIYPVFIRKYEKVGKSAYRQHLVRNLALNGLFLLFLTIQDRATRAMTLDIAPYHSLWTFMNDVAVTGIFMTPFLTKPFREKTWTKFTAGGALILIYAFTRTTLLWYAGTVDAGGGGGIGACVGFTGIVLLVAGIFDLLRKKEAYFYYATGGLAVIGALALFVFKNFEALVSSPEQAQKLIDDADAFGSLWDPRLSIGGAFTASFMIGSLAVFMVFYALFYAFNHHVLKDKAIWGLATMGRNLMLYLFLSILLGVIVAFIPLGDAWEEERISGGVAIALTVAVAIGCLALTIPLYRKKIVFKL